MPATTDRSREEVVNVHLARLLRVRLGLNAVAETLRGGAWPDIIVRRADGPVVIETELEPARTVDADALARLGLEIDGSPVQIAFAVTVPGQLRQVDQSQLDQRLTTANLAWREWRLDGTSGPNLSGEPSRAWGRRRAGGAAGGQPGSSPWRHSIRAYGGLVHGYTSHPERWLA